jgi:hypothetical protein
MTSSHLSSTGPAGALPSAGTQEARLNSRDHFNDLAVEFQRCLDFARGNVDTLQYKLENSRTTADIAALFTKEVLVSLGGTAAYQYHLVNAIHQQAVAPGGAVSAQQLALICGYNLIPAAARLVHRACRARLLREPRGLYRAARFTRDNIPRSDPDFRDFWGGTVLPELRQFCPPRFVRGKPDPWALAADNVVACGVLAEQVMIAPNEDSGQPPATAFGGATLKDIAARVSRCPQTIRNAAKNAGIPRAPVGKHGYPYSAHDICAIAHARAQLGANEEERKKWDAYLSEIGQPGLESRLQAKRQRDPRP